MDELSGGAIRSIDAALANPIFAADGNAAGELFIINLCASMTPMTVGKGLAGFEQYKLYQVSRMEDGRRRFRLRLGFFPDEAAAEIVLNAVRGNYPTAFTACLAEEDLRHAPAGHRTLKPKAVPSPPTPAPAATKAVPIAPTRTAAPKAPAVSAPKNSTPPVSTATVSKPTPPMAAPTTRSATSSVQTAQVTNKPVTPAVQPKPQASAITLSADSPPPKAARDVPHDPTKPTSTHSAAALTQASGNAAGIELAHESAQPQPAPATATAKPFAPFHVATGVQVPNVNFELEKEPNAAPGMVANPPATQRVNPTPQTSAKADRPSLLDKPLPTAAAMPPPLPMTSRADMIPVLDSTQTIRTLSPAELNDENQPKWFAVQLAISEQPVNLDTMPRLDIFAAYCLYSVAVMEEGSIRHALRLGFFKEEMSADAVSGYLKTFFPTPKILRISAAEHKRFADPPPRKPAPRPDNVVKLDEARDRAHKPATPTAAPTAPAATKSAAPAKNAARTASPATKHAPVAPKKTPGHMKTGKHQTLGEQLREEARQVILSQSGIHKQQPRQGSLLSRLVDKLKP